MFNPDKYLTVRWQMGGRVYPVLDCYGLVHEVRKDLGLPKWPDFSGVISEGDAMHKIVTSFQSNVVECMPCLGAVAVCYKAEMAVHLGIVVTVDGELRVMESQIRTNATLLSIGRFESRYMGKVRYFK